MSSRSDTNKTVGSAAIPRDGGTAAPDSSLLAELEQLRQENAALRRQLGSAGAASGNGSAVANSANAAGQKPASPPLQPVDPAAESRPVQAGAPIYRELLQAMSAEFPIGVFQADGRGVITHVDDCLCRILGMDRAEFSNWGWHARVHPDDLGQVKAVWSEGASPWPERCDMEFRVLRPDGSVAHLAVRVRQTVLHDGDASLPSNGTADQGDEHFLGFAQDLTLLRDLEHSAHIKGELNRQIVASSTDAVHVLNADGQVIEMTAQAGHQLGFDNLAAAQAHPWTQWWANGGGRLAADALDAGLQGVGSRFLASRTSDNGQTRWWDTAVSPISDDGGKVRMLLVVSRDVTTQHQQQREIERLNLELEARVARRTEELLRQQQFLQTITDQIPGLLCYIDSKQIVRFANAEYQRMLGIDPEMMVGKPIHRYLPPEMWKEIEPHLASALMGSEQYFESNRTLPNGKKIDVRAHYRPDIRGDKVLGVYTQVLDITAQKDLERRAENLNDELEAKISERSRELLESEQKFRLMSDNLRDYMIYFLDAQGRVTDWTDSAQRMTGHTPVETMGKQVQELLMGAVASHPSVQDFPTMEQMLRHAAARGQHEWQAWHRRKDGSEYFGFSILIALRDQAGELEGFAGLTRDMTDAKRLQDLMYNINLELEKRVESRTHQLKIANNELESFSYSVSHDLRSPLRHISSFVMLLEEHLGTNLDETTHKYLNTIRNSSKNMGLLIDGLLAFSRMGRAAMAATPINMSELVADAISQISIDAKEHPVEWIQPEEYPDVECDPILMKEVWANLLGNAYKYSRTKPKSEIEIGWFTNDSAGYTFFVRDNGVGFDTKYADKLFGVFQRLHRSSEFEGTGIGLALVKKIIVRHHGHIWAESEVGIGSKFLFTLPLKQPQPSPADSEPESNTVEAER